MAGRSLFRFDLRFVARRKKDRAAETAWEEGGYLGAVAKGEDKWHATTELVSPPPGPPCNDTCPWSHLPGFRPQPLYWHELRPAPDADLPWARPGGPSGLSTSGAQLSPPWTPKEPALPHAAPEAASAMASRPDDVEAPPGGGGVHGGGTVT